MLGAGRAASACPSDRRPRLPRSARLRRRVEYQRAYEFGIRVAGRYMVVFVRTRRQQDQAGPRLGVTASRRVGKAVVRARSKRRLRELFRTDTGGFSGWDVDVVINARRGVADAPWSELARDYARCVEKVTKRLAGGA